MTATEANSSPLFPAILPNTFFTAPVDVPEYANNTPAIIIETLNINIPFPTPAKAENSQLTIPLTCSEYFTTASCKLSEANCQKSIIGFVNDGQSAVLAPGGGIKCCPVL